MLNKLHNKGLKITKLLQSRGFKAFWVGGTVRDMIIGRNITNLDIATSAEPEEIKALLKKSRIYAKSAGEKFGTILAVTSFGPVEVTTFRRESRYLKRRRPETVEFIQDYKADAERRDFTINAIYYDPVEKKFYDPQQGRRDIVRKLIKFVGDPKKRIEEDALRMLRAVRFSIQLNFKIEKNSFAAIKTRAKYIQSISGERIKAELDKILLSENPEGGIRLLDKIGLLQFIMPEVTSLKTIFHKSKLYHLEGSVFEHTLLVLRNLPARNLLLAYAALYHDTGKTSTAVPKKKHGSVVNSFPRHEFVSASLFGEFAKRLHFGRTDRDLVLWITKMHMKRVAFGRDMSLAKKIQLTKHKYFPLLVELWRADQLGNLSLSNDKVVPSTPHSYQEGLKLLSILQSKKKILTKIATGRFILNETKLLAGPEIGVIKNNLENKIISGEIKNISDAKKYLKKFTRNT